MAIVPALIADSHDAPFRQGTIETRSLRDDDVRIAIQWAGICHSDIHTKRNEWGEAHFPLTPGHEIAGEITEVGAGVTRHKVGDRVGVGCMVDSCGECEQCKNGFEQFCTKPAVFTYNSQGYDGEWTNGGYAQEIVVSERFACKIPDGLDLDVAAPLLCAGITTFSPLKRFGAGPGKVVGVVGVGGLGHVAVKIAKAMGAEVRTLSRSEAKAQDAMDLGSSQHIATSDKDAMRAASGTMDLIINTVSADIDMGAHLRLLKPFGALISVGIAPGNYNFRPGMLGGNKVLGTSMIGGIPETEEMLRFCAEHGIGATVEKIDADFVDEAYDKVVAGDVRYRYVIDTSTIKPDAE